MAPEIEVTCPTVNTLNSLNIEHEAKVTNALNTLNIEHEAKIANTLDSLKNEYQAKIVKLNQDLGNCRNPQTIGEYFSNFSLYVPFHSEILFLFHYRIISSNIIFNTQHTEN